MGTGPRECMRPDCHRPAVRSLTPKFARTTLAWYGCAAHWPAMADALYIGQPADSGHVEVRHLGRPREES